MVRVVSIQTHTAQAATCIIASTIALPQLPPHAVENAVETAGMSDSINTTLAVRRNVRMGVAALLAIAPNTNTAPVVRMAVSRVGNTHPSGVNFGSGRNSATAAALTTSTAPIEHTIAKGPTQAIRDRSISDRESERSLMFDPTSCRPAAAAAR